MHESATRSIPYQPDEVRWAQCRPAVHRVPPPQPGDRVLLRREPWGQVVRGEVAYVQPLDDPSIDNPYLWELQRDPETGAYLITPAGQPVAVKHPDPWPVVHVAWSGGVDYTQEARLRGSAGWLPLDWESRWRPMPQVIVATATGVPHSPRPA